MKLRTLILVLALTASAALAAPATSPVTIIFDTDMETDCDDAGALAVLHALADRGECEILAVMLSAKNPWSAACCDVINTYYGRPDIPIGAPKGPAPDKPSRYARQLAEQFPHDLKSGTDAPNAAELYRDILMQQEDRSVTIVTVGYMTNLRDLLKLPAGDGKRGGAELVKTKVKLWVCMGGNFIGNPPKDDLKLGNNNFTFDAPAAHYAIHNWPGPIMFVGREVASVPSGVRVGENLKNTPMSNPVRVAYRLYHNGQDRSRHVADPASVLFAVRGLRDCWDTRSNGFMDLKPDMTFAWRSDIDRQQGYLVKKLVDGRPNDRHIERVLDELMTQPPKVKK